MARFATLVALNVDDALPDAWVDEVKAFHDYHIVSGGDVASSATIAITSHDHGVTGTTTIDNINDASGAAVGQTVTLRMKGTITIRNNGGGSGNIRSVSGNDLKLVSGDYITFVYDGSVWREFGQSITYGQFSTGAVANSPSTTGVGIFGSYLEAVSPSATDSAVVAAVTGDSNWRVILRKDGTLVLGSGSATGDTTLGRTAAGVLTLDNVLRQNKVSATYGTTVTPDARAGAYQLITVTNSSAFTVALPSNAPTSGETQDLTLEIYNSTGGNSGTISFGAYVPLTSGRPVNIPSVLPAGSRYVIALRWTGTQWVILGQGATQIA